MSLDPRIDVVREKYGLSRDDFWQLPQKAGTWLVKHAALEVAAAQAGIRFDMPVILEADGAGGIAALCVRGEMGDRWEWATGEASPKNSKNAYPWAMAEKRAKDRVILKLIGIHGLVYSEDEADFDAPRQPDAPKTLVKEQREIWAAMRDELDACMSLDDLAGLWRSPAFQTEFKKLKADWAEQINAHKEARKAELAGRGGRVAPNFDNMEAAHG